MLPNILPITLYDSYLKQKVIITPDQAVEPGKLKIYGCGPTIYYYQHIGNMRAIWLPDTICKVARLAGWETEWVSNITDVGHLVGDGDEGEDKIEVGAKREKKSVEEIVNRYLEDFKAQCKALNFDLPTGKYQPKATEYIKEQMVLALELLRDGKAYLTEDGIYLDTKHIPPVPSYLVTSPQPPSRGEQEELLHSLLQSSKGEILPLDSTRKYPPNREGKEVLQTGFLASKSRLELAREYKINKKGWNFVTYNNDLSTFSKEMRNDPTEAEKRFWDIVRKDETLGSFTWNRQKPIDNFIADFYCRELKLVIEIDGGIHDSDQAKSYDKERSDIFRGLGIDVLRFSNDEVLLSSDLVLAQIVNWANTLPLKGIEEISKTEKTIIFDVDGVLTQAFKWGEALEQKYGITVEQQSEFFNQHWFEIATGKADLKELLKPYLIKWNWQSTMDDFLNFWFEHDLHPIQETLSLAKRLKNIGFKIVVATDQEKNRLNYLKTHLLDSEIFDEIYTSCELGLSKKNIEFWHQLIDILNINPINAIVIDDGEKQIENANQVGFNTILYKFGESNLKKEIELLIPNLTVSDEVNTSPLKGAGGMSTIHKPLIIAIDGGGGSGKSTLARELNKNIPDSLLIEMDSFEKTWLFSEEFIQKNFEIDFIKNYDFDEIKLKILENKQKILIVEGCFANMLNIDFDLKIWVELDSKICAERLNQREINEHPELDPEIIKLSTKKWQEAEERYRQNFKPEEQADLIVSTQDVPLSRGSHEVGGVVSLIVSTKNNNTNQLENTPPLKGAGGMSVVDYEIIADFTEFVPQVKEIFWKVPLWWQTKFPNEKLESWRILDGGVISNTILLNEKYVLKILAEKYEWAKRNSETEYDDILNRYKIIQKEFNLDFIPEILEVQDLNTIFNAPIILMEYEPFQGVFETYYQLQPDQKQKITETTTKIIKNFHNNQVQKNQSFNTQNLLNFATKSFEKYQDKISEKYKNIIQNALQNYKTRQVFEDLVYIHGDIHFGNLLFENPEKSYLIDFDWLDLQPNWVELRGLFQGFLLTECTVRKDLEIYYKTPLYKEFIEIIKLYPELLPKDKIKEIELLFIDALVYKLAHSKFSDITEKLFNLVFEQNLFELLANRKFEEAGGLSEAEFSLFTPPLKGVGGMFSTHKPLIIAIDGRGGSGKSTLAKKLAESIPDSIAIEQDKYLEFMKGMDTTAETWDSKNFDLDKQALNEELKKNQDKNVIILEGIKSFENVDSDLKIWIDSDPNIASKRAENRDVQGNVNPIGFKKFWQEFEEHQEKYINLEKPQEQADLIISTEDMPLFRGSHEVGGVVSPAIKTILDKIHKLQGKHQSPYPGGDHAVIGGSFQTISQDMLLCKNFHEVGGVVSSNEPNYTGRDIVQTEKRNLEDFAVWKFVDEKSLQKWRFADFSEALILLEQTTNDKFKTLKNGEILAAKWGCPGWHSECVAMICAILGENKIKDRKHFSFTDFVTLNDTSNTLLSPPLKGVGGMSNQQAVIDIHTGGEDHIDIHHKNERLQAEALGFNLSKYWVHNKFNLVDGKKMSKSLGNVFLVTGKKEETGFESIQERGFDPLAYRLMLLEHHYTEQMNFTWEKLEQSQNRLWNLRKEAAKLQSFYKQFSDQKVEKFDQNKFGIMKKEWLDILTNDLDFPKFLSLYQEKLTETANKIQSKQELDNTSYYLLLRFDEDLLELKLWEKDILNVIYEMMEQRILAKKDKNYALSDKIRNEILKLGYQVDDYFWGSGVWWKGVKN